MNLGHTIIERIKKNFADLTSSQKIIAKFILDNPNLLAVYPAKKIGNLTNTSEATVIRFCSSLGYSGYSEFQEQVRRSLLLSNDKRGPVQKYLENTGGIINKENCFRLNIQNDINSLQQVLNDLPDESYKKAVELMVQAEKVVVVGFRWLHTPAKWLFSVLNTIKGNTYLYTGVIDNLDYFISERDSDWLVIALSFSRHSTEMIEVVKAAKSIGAKILAITEGEFSPVGIEANLTIKVNVPQPVGINGMPTLFSVLNTLINGFWVFDSENVQKRVKDYDQLTSQFYSFIGDDDVPIL